MPDITMCSGEDCPLKATCYRYKAKPSDYCQSYFTESPYDAKENKCNYYWESDKKPITKPNN